jgi:hypothetical protein
LFLMQSCTMNICILPGASSSHVPNLLFICIINETAGGWGEGEGGGWGGSQFKFTRQLFFTLVGFGRACAPVRCAHPSFDLIATPDGALRAPPAYRSFAAFIYPPKLSISSNSIARGVYLSIGLSCTLLSYIASY